MVKNENCFRLFDPCFDEVISVNLSLFLNNSAYSYIVFIEKNQTFTYIAINIREHLRKICSQF